MALPERKPRKHLRKGAKMENKELKPCPFCGGEAFIRFLMGKAHIQPIHTKKCTVKPDTWLISDLTINKQIDAWNRRVNDGT